MKYFVLAGEASGDKQAALLVKAIRQHDPSARISAWGGEAMEAQGATVTRHYRELAYMGFTEVIRHLPAIFKNFKRCKQEILAFSPEALILVDYPGFNLRMAVWAWKQGIPVYYYISPQLWAWHTSRVYKIRKAVRKMYVILPFEKEFYERYDMDVMFIGHPLALEIKQRGGATFTPAQGHIALLPGSRKNEVERILPEMAALTRLMPQHTFYVAAVTHLPVSLYGKYLEGMHNVHLVTGDMQTVLNHCEAAVVTSGTATLETALHGVPQIVVYKGSRISFQIARRLIKVKFISLVNLIMGKLVVPELIQSECNAKLMHDHLKDIMTPAVSEEIRDAYQALSVLLTTGGGAAAAALDIISDLDKRKKESWLTRN